MTRTAAEGPVPPAAGADAELAPDDHALLAGLEHVLALYHRATLADVEPDEVPGFWSRRRPCGGRRGGCHAAWHWGLGCEGPVRHTIRYLDEDRDAHGCVISPYRTWRFARELLAAGRWPRPLAADKNTPRSAW